MTWVHVHYLANENENQWSCHIASASCDSSWVCVALRIFIFSLTKPLILEVYLPITTILWSSSECIWLKSQKLWQWNHNCSTVKQRTHRKIINLLKCMFLSSGCMNILPILNSAVCQGHYLKGQRKIHKLFET